MNDSPNEQQRIKNPSNENISNRGNHIKRITAFLMGAISGMAVGVYDNLKGGAVEGISEWIRYQYTSPIFIIELSDPVPVNKDNLELLRVNGDGKPTLIKNISMPPSTLQDGRTKFIEVTVSPGSYYIRLGRDSEFGAQVLSYQLIRLSKPDEPVKVDTSKSMWSTTDKLTTIPTPGGVAGKTTGTRWTLTSSESEALASAEGRSASILRAALGQLGIWEGGVDADKRAIAAYWQAATAAGGISPVSENDPVYGLWGGAFLAWAVAQGGGHPPSGAAAFRSWQNWGTMVDPSRAKPGNIVIVETGQRQAPTPSGLMVGFFLRPRDGCVEMVTGNLADRVVITCVQGRVLSYRSAD